LKPQKLWTEREIEILRELYPKQEIGRFDLAKVLNRSTGAIESKASALGIRKERRDNINEEYLESLRRIVKF